MKSPCQLKCQTLYLAVYLIVTNYKYIILTLKLLIYSSLKVSLLSKYLFFNLLID